ncbi:MAG: hypothetical protein WBM17_04875 [Anaerolineales bacterium]
MKPRNSFGIVIINASLIIAAGGCGGSPTGTVPATTTVTPSAINLPTVTMAITPTLEPTDDPGLSLGWDLPPTYTGEVLYSSPLLYNAFIARSQNGTVYTMLGTGSNPGISLIDLKQGTATPILRLPQASGMSNPVGGPEDTLIVGVGPDVWQITPDGKHKLWGHSPDGFPIFYTNDGRLLGRSFDGRLIEIKQDGTTVEITGGFQLIGDVLVTPEGVILVYDIPTGDIIRVDPDGSKRVLVKSVLPGDGVNFGMDFDGQVYFNKNGFWDLNRLDIESGKATSIRNSYSPCAWNRGDIVFIEPGKLLLTGDQLSWSDLQTKESGILVHGTAGTFAADIGPDGALYVGASGCGDQIPAQVLRIADDGTRTVYADNLRGTIIQISFALDNGLYIASREDGTNHIQFLPANGVTPVEIPGPKAAPIMSMAVDPVTGNLLFTIPGGLTVQEYDRNGLRRQAGFHFPEAINEFRLAFAPDGKLYGLAGFGISNTDFRGPWVLNLDVTGKSYTVLSELSHVATGVMSVFTVDDRGNLWIIVNPDSNLYQITPDGTVTLFAGKLPIDMPAIQVDPSGDIYFTCGEGIFRIYRKP